MKQSYLSMQYFRSRTVALVLAVMLAVVTACPAYAKTMLVVDEDGQAIVVRFEFQESVSDTGGNECLPSEPIGTITGTVTGAGQIVDTNRGFHERLTSTLDYRVDFPDGSYVLGTAVEHGVFYVNFRNSQTTHTGVVHEPRSLYAADGQPIGRVMIHFLNHLTYRDVNGNGQPDPGEITASIEDFQFKCY